jgi:TolB-like protein/Tfp pilus assembly protein PilF
LSFLNELKRRNVLRVAAAYLVLAWLIIQVVETIFPIYGFSDASIRMVITILAIGLIPTVIFTWAFELTPEGLKKESEADRSRSIVPNTGKKLDRMIMVVLALALGYFAFDKFALNPQREAVVQEQVFAQVEQARQKGRTEGRVESYGDQSIAVLAFDDMSPEGDQEYLSDGIAEELLNLLAKIPELRVISRSSAFSFKGQNLELTEIGERLNVAHILEGSVRKSGNQVRITAQLIEARSDTHLWSETYDRQLDDIFAIQDDIAAMVVEQLKITLLGQIPHAKEVNPEAYSLYLQARHLRRQFSAESYEQSIALYQQALAIEPDYPAAWIGLAVVYFNQASNGLLPAAEGFAQAREAAERALAIDPDYALAHAVLGDNAMDTDLTQAARHYERALELDPVNIDIIGGAASLLYALGRPDEAITLQEYATAHDPVNPGGHGRLSTSYFCAGRWDAAIASLQTALRLSPDAIGGHYMLGTFLLFQGNAEAALAELAQESFEIGRLFGLAMAQHALGDTRAADSVLAELIEKFAQDTAYNIAYVMAFRNEVDRAFEWLNKAVENADPGLAGIVCQPEFSNLHDDPRWLPFLESIGKSPEQLAAIEFKVTLPQ